MIVWQGQDQDLLPTRYSILICLYGERAQVTKLRRSEDDLLLLPGSELGRSPGLADAPQSTEPSQHSFTGYLYPKRLLTMSSVLQKSPNYRLPSFQNIRTNCQFPPNVEVMVFKDPKHSSVNSLSNSLKYQFHPSAEVSIFFNTRPSTFAPLCLPC